MNTGAKKTRLWPKNPNSNCLSFVLFCLGFNLQRPTLCAPKLAPVPLGVINLTNQNTQTS